MRYARLSAVVALLVLLVLPAASHAVGAVQSGWWTSAPVPTAPDVPDGGALLQGGPTVDEPVAFAAVSVALANGERPGVLTLAVAPNSATTPNAAITVCPLTKAFTPAAGGAMADAPSFDCTAKVAATRSDDGTTFRVDTSTLARDGTLSIALLPTSVTDRIALAPVDASALATSGAASSSSTGSSVATSGRAASSGAPVSGRAPATATPAPAAGNGTAAAPTASPPARTGGAPSVVPASSAGSTSSKLGIAFVALVVLIAALWLFAGNAHAESPDRAAQAPMFEGAPS